MREEIDGLEEAMACDVIPCFYADSDFKFGHGWAVEVIDGRPRCAGCVEWLEQKQ